MREELGEGAIATWEVGTLVQSVDGLYEPWERHGTGSVGTS